MQIELKFWIGPEYLTDLLQLDLLAQHAAATAHASHSNSIYFDTRDFLLKRHGANLQIAPVGKHWRQSLTIGLANHVNMDRDPVCVSDISTPAPDSSVLAEFFNHAREPRHRLSGNTISDSLIPICTINHQRTIWHVDFGQGREADLILDQGEVESDSRKQTICELTFRHEVGKTDAFFDFAFAIQQRFKLRVAYMSQMEIGYAMREPGIIHASGAQHVILNRDANTAQGMESIIRNCLSHIFGNTAGVLIGDDGESIHQMRVGLRRLRSAVEIFEPLRSCPEKLQIELAWLSRLLGEARDWDVFDFATLAPLAGRNIVMQDMFHQLQKRTQQELTRKRGAVAAGVGSMRAARMWLMLEQWLANANEARIHDRSSLKDFSERNLRRSHKKMLTRHASMDPLRSDSLHRLRISLKKLRYITEFFISYYRKKSAGRFIAKLGRLQDMFGNSNDLLVADKLLCFLADKYPDLSESCTYFRGYLAAERNARLGKMSRKISRFATMKKPALRS